MAADFITLSEMVKRARTRLARGEWDYLMGAAETETSLKRNRLAFDRLALKARVLLHDVAKVQTRRTLLGFDQRIPVLLAPIGSVQVFEQGGGVSTARAAEKFGVIQILSSACLPDFETVARECKGTKIYQLYAQGDEAWTMGVLERAQTAGYNALCLTVDTQVYSRRERDLLKRYVPLSGRRLEATMAPTSPWLQASFSWDFVKRIKDRFRIPLVLKGIACGEDAEIAASSGVDIVYVSNHGGRQLDQGRGTLDMLPEVVRAVGGRAKVVVDGGILRGTDVLKALALGADAVGIGRLGGLAMAAGGVDAVVRMLEILENEMLINLALMGLSSIDQLGPDCVLPAEPVVQAHVLSAFPLLDEDY
jgi:glycolate oxidase